MRYKSIFLIITVVTLIFVFSAFQAKKVETKSSPEVKTVEDLIALKLEERITEFKKRTFERCTDKVMRRANEKVDSILIARARQTIIIDSIQKPPKPTKPEKPEVPIVEDTTPVKPLLDKID